MKTCARCNVEKPETEFYPKVKGGKTLRHICKECQTAATKISSYKSRHGITQEDAARIAEEQGGCAICKKLDGVWHIDHDHTCKGCTNRRGSCEACRRGVLCSNCNTAIGLFGEDVQLIQSAIAYLEYWNEKLHAGT
jgi:hypothetical protein